MPNLPKASKKSWIAENRGNHRGRVRTEKDSFYHTTAWRTLRRKYITANPLCEECKRRGRITPGQVIDHITPIKQDGDPLNWNNLQTLCNPCHASKSGKESHAK
jgi:5-methylcytosine-specific restriction endonuclease McrA